MLDVKVVGKEFDYAVGYEKGYFDNIEIYSLVMDLEVYAGANVYINTNERVIEVYSTKLSADFQGNVELDFKG